SAVSRGTAIFIGLAFCGVDVPVTREPPGLATGGSGPECSSGNGDDLLRHDEPMPTRSLNINDHRLELETGDITRQAVDAIANAANSALRFGGGVDGAIHRAAGPGLLDELVRRYPNGTPTGTAVETSGHRLAARWVLQAAGP